MGARKVSNLVAAGAEVTVVSPDVTETLASQIDSHQIAWVQSPYSEEHLEGVFLVVAATNDEKLNAGIVTRATELGALVCDASSAERTQVIFGALHQGEAGVTVAVFTDGRDPTTARHTRDRIAEMLDQNPEQEDRSGSA